jgi:hypothetical protein
MAPTHKKLERRPVSWGPHPQETLTRGTIPMESLTWGTSRVYLLGPRATAGDGASSTGGPAALRLACDGLEGMADHLLESIHDLLASDPEWP